jgi:hypothetical protein
MINPFHRAAAPVPALYAQISKGKIKKGKAFARSPGLGLSSGSVPRRRGLRFVPQADPDLCVNQMRAARALDMRMARADE